jgi:hypothetical protein
VPGAAIRLEQTFVGAESRGCRSYSMAIAALTCRTLRWTMRVGGALVAAVAVSGAFAAGQAWQDAVDYTKLKTRLGANVPTGAGGVISMVEGTNPGGASYVNPGTGEFNGNNDANSTPVSFTDQSGVASNGISNHANGVGFYLFGDLTSMSDGANQVVHYEAGNWLANGALHYNTSAQPSQMAFRVQNHSWIVYSLNVNNPSQDVSALRRFDYVIETNDTTAVVGANNYIASAPHHPALMAHSYNAIVVGRSDSQHSRGTTGVHSDDWPGNPNPGASNYGANYGVGRYKPDIVAPLTVTSHSTPVVGSAALLLHEEAAGTDGAKSEVIKAMLLAGATKQEFAAFQDPLSGNALNPWARTATQPLDDLFGAGELNVYNSYLMTVGGQHLGSTSTPSTPVASSGWSYKGKTAADELYYNLVVPEGSTAAELSVILAWNAKITDLDSGSNFNPTESLQNLNLTLYNSTDSYMGEMLDQSISSVDNVEHIYQTNLQPGTYTLKVSGAANWDYGLAWRMATQFDQVSADFDGDGAVSGNDFLIWQSNIGTLLGATHGQGDADGDGDVDSDDLAAVNNKVLPNVLPPLAVSAVAAIPEPATWAIAAGALFAAAGWKWRRASGRVGHDQRPI